VRGQTLGDMLEQDRPAPEQARKVLSDLFGAMVYAHSRGVIHRDLKPDNIMLTEKGLLKVMDFGLAKEEDSEKLTQTGTALGTPAYMAPEQIQGDDLDPRTDQYSLGIIAYEVLAGRLPFDASDVMQLLFAQMTATPPPPSQFNPTLPDEVDAALLKMLAKTAEERFATTEEATHALMVALEGYR
ncbi:MAG: serine/threonine protein kinase, partial [Candidatus Eremiobacteraeota bacterium]|nr:serine/threonine protein kinase [Candidatus Eremiobacteraeota bacterium]